MFTKRFFIILLFSLLIHLSPSDRHTVHAGQQYVKPIDQATPLVVVANSCQGIVTESAYALMTLPVTEGLAGEVNALIASGVPPVIAVSSQADFVVSGSGTAGYQAQVTVFIEDTNGNRYTVDQFGEIEVATSSWELKNVLVTSLTSEVMPGDLIGIEVTGQGYANAGGCDLVDQANLIWEVAAALCNNELVEDCFR